MAFAWAEGYRAKVPADVAGPEIMRLAGDRGVDGLQAEEVIEAAKDESSPLHGASVWDDKEAAAEHRLHQARMLLNSIRVVVKIESREPIAVRPIVNLKDGAGYRSAVAVQRDPDLRERMIELALADVRSAKTRLAQVRGLHEVVRRLAAIERDVEKEQRHQTVSA